MTRAIRPASPVEPINVDQLLDDLVLNDLTAICDRTGLTMAELATLAAGHAAPTDPALLVDDDEAHAGHPPLDPALLARAELHDVGPSDREAERLIRGLTAAMPGFEDGCE
jgi:hypothetical protein